MKLRALVKGTFAACIVAFAALFLCAALVYFGAADEKAASMGTFAGVALGGFLGAFISAKTAGGRVLINALAVSLVCSLAAAALSWCLNGGFVFGARLISVFACLFGTGFLGAVFGR